MPSDERFDALQELGSIIHEIHFNDIPDESVLEALTENAPNIRLHMPLDKVLNDLTNNVNWSTKIISGNLVTDLFDDSEYLYNYPELEHLVLTSTCSADYLDSNDLSKLQLAVINLTKLKSLQFNIKKMNAGAIQQIQEAFQYYDAININYITHQPKRRKRLTQSEDID